MAVAMEVTWRGVELRGGGAGLSTSGSKKRAWGADTEKLMQLMMGQFGTKVKREEEEVTLDLFGAAGVTSELELDPDQPLPSNWEKCLDLKTGGVYFVNKSTGARTTEDPRKEFKPRVSSEEAAAAAATTTPLEFLGSKLSETLREESLRAPTFSKSTGKQLWSLQLDDRADDNLELNLNLSPSPSRHQSVCTMEMVERALKTVKKPKLTTSSSFSSLTSLRSDNSHSTSSSSSTSAHAADSTTTLVMGACTRCLMYVMLHKSDPKCPRCESDVPLDSFAAASPPASCKRQRVDPESP